MRARKGGKMDVVMMLHPSVAKAPSFSIGKKISENEISCETEDQFGN